MHSVPSNTQNLTLDKQRDCVVFCKTEQTPDGNCVRLLLSSQKSSVELVENHKTKYSLIFPERQMANETDCLSNHEHPTFNENRTLMSQQPLTQEQKLRGEEYSSVTSEITNGELHSSVSFTKRDLGIHEQRSHTEQPFAERSIETVHPSNSFIQIPIEIHNISLMRSSEFIESKEENSTLEKPDNTELKFNNNDRDITMNIDKRNEAVVPNITRSSLKRNMTPPLLPLSQTSDLKECMHIVLLLILGVLAFGVFYFLQSYKPKSNTAAAVGSVSGGIVLLMLFFCVYIIIKDNGLYCLQNSSQNV